MTSLIGKTIGKYKFVEVLGVGGMAQVYRAVQFPLDRDVAVKILHTYLTEQADVTDRFLREAKAMASLRHPNIVQVYDYAFEDNIYYMAMEFLDGVSVEDRLLTLNEQSNSATSLPVEEALDIVIQVAQALDFAHRQGIVHRDVKPANIMKTADGRIVLTDFGIAAILSEKRLTVEGTTIGTPSYISPERALGKQGDERSDIYSLGAVLYQLVTGQLPFEADTLYGLIMKHVNDTLPLPTEINSRLKAPVEQIILKAMAKEATDRYQTAGEFAADMQTVLDGKRININKDTKSGEVLVTASKYKAYVGWGAVVIVLLIGLIFALGRGDDTADAILPPNQAFSETFDSNTVGWPITDSPVSRQLVGETYEILVEAPGRTITSYPKKLGVYDKFSYSVEATLLNGQPESGYGLVFHRQDDANFYVFAVNGLQQWSIWRLETGVWHELRDLPAGETWTSSEAVLPLGQVNHLYIEIDGSTFNLFINDEHLQQVSDNNASFTTGGIGFYVASSQAGNDTLAQVYFDNVTLVPIVALTSSSTVAD